MFNFNIAPLHARRIAVADLQRLQDVLDKIDDLRIDNINREKIRNVISQAKTSLLRDQAIITGATLPTRIDRYMKSRNDYVNRLLSNSNITPTCRELGNDVLSESDHFEHEQKFIELKSQCV